MKTYFVWIMLEDDDHFNKSLLSIKPCAILKTWTSGKLGKEYAVRLEEDEYLMLSLSVNLNLQHQQVEESTRYIGRDQRIYIDRITNAG